jgi:hypothetical protein
MKEGIHKPERFDKLNAHSIVNRGMPIERGEGQRQVNYIAHDNESFAYHFWDMPTEISEGFVLRVRTKIYGIEEEFLFAWKGTPQGEDELLAQLFIYEDIPIRPMEQVLAEFEKLANWLEALGMTVDIPLSKKVLMWLRPAREELDNSLTGTCWKVESIQCFLGTRFEVRVRLRAQTAGYPTYAGISSEDFFYEEDAEWDGVWKVLEGLVQTAPRSKVS